MRQKCLFAKSKTGKILTLRRGHSVWGKAILLGTVHWEDAKAKQVFAFCVFVYFGNIFVFLSPQLTEKMPRPDKCKSSDLLKFLIDCQSPQRLVTFTDICLSEPIRKVLKMILNVSKKRITFYFGDAGRHLPIISRKGLRYISLDECRKRSHGKNDNLKILTISENTFLLKSV